MLERWAFELALANHELIGLQRRLDSAFSRSGQPLMALRACASWKPPFRDS
jgi:hypothetical protein